MYHLIKKYNRKLLAFFTILLVIVFVITSGPNQFTGTGPREDLIIGAIGSEKIRLRDVENARREWDILRSAVVTQSPVQLSPEEPARNRSILELLTQSQQGQISAFPVSAARDISEKPELFMLLLKEADRMAVFATDDEVRGLFGGQFGVRLPDNRIVEFDNVTDARLKDSVLRSVGSLFRVLKTFQTAASAVKVSAPMREYDLARSLQAIKLRLVEFQTKDYVSQLAAPAPEQLQAHFEKYAGNLPGEITSENPFGFGYKLPDRVGFQSISIPKSELRKVVRASKSDYDWEVEARKYYQKHPSEFATTQPTSKPTDSFSLGPVVGAPTTVPTTRPFAEVKEQIVEQVVAPQVQPLLVKVQAFVTDKLAADYATYTAAKPTTTPTTLAAASPTTLPTTGVASAGAAAGPLTSYGVPYGSYDYLQKLAADVQVKFGVLPATASHADKPRSAEELGKITGIGESRVGFISFANYATQKSQELFPGYPAQIPPKIAVWQPSQPVTDAGDTAYVFRLTEISPSHRPTDMRDSMAGVQADYQKLAALELTKAEALKLRDQAADKGLPSAAGQRPVITTGDFDLESADIPNFPVPAPARREFMQNAFNLLSVVSSTRPSGAVGLIEMPAEGKVLVAEVLDVKPKWSGPRYLAEANVSRQLMRQLVEQNMQAEWFAYDNVVARLGFAPDSRGKKADDQTPG